jgi:hypothetical protein
MECDGADLWSGKAGCHSIVDDEEFVRGTWRGELESSPSQGQGVRCDERSFLGTV